MIGQLTEWAFREDEPSNVRKGLPVAQTSETRFLLASTAAKYDRFHLRGESRNGRKLDQVPARHRRPEGVLMLFYDLPDGQVPE
jgi:hypothetical protein